jgi:hypothetical protein
MAGKSGVYKWLAVNFAALAQKNSMLSTPAEARCPDGEHCAFVFAKLFEEALDARKRLSMPGIQNPVYEGANRPESMIAIMP